MTTYRISALAAAFVRMWRGWTVMLSVIVVNAILQALLVWRPWTYESGLWNTATAVASAIIMWLAFGLLASTALGVLAGRVSWRDATARLLASAWRYPVWSLVWIVVVALGLALYVVPGVIVIVLTPFLALAALDGRGNALAVDLRVLGARFWRWLITTLIAVVVLVLAWYASGFVTFFLRGSLASLVIWLVGGWLIGWFTTAYALIYVGARRQGRAGLD